VPSRGYVDDATAERLKKIRAVDRDRAEKRLRRDVPTDEAVKGARGTGKTPGKKQDEASNSIRPKPVFDYRL
jgi:hypothetical protein